MTISEVLAIHLIADGVYITGYIDKTFVAAQQEENNFDTWCF
jgi:hypothetical protein